MLSYKVIFQNAYSILQPTEFLPSRAFWGDFFVLAAVIQSVLELLVSLQRNYGHRHLVSKFVNFQNDFCYYSFFFFHLGFIGNPRFVDRYNQWFSLVNYVYIYIYISYFVQVKSVCQFQINCHFDLKH